MKITLRGWEVRFDRSNNIFSVTTTRTDGSGVTGYKKTHSGAQSELAYAFAVHSISPSTHERDSDLVKALFHNIEFSLQVMQSGELQMYCSGLPDYGIDHFEWSVNNETSPSCVLLLELW